MQEEINLSTLNITEFDSSNTIYIKDKDGFNKPLYLCQFVSYDNRKNDITGKILQSDGSGHGRGIGEVITNKLSQCALYGSATEDNSHKFFHWFSTLGYALHPTEEYKIVENENHCSKHPSFGMALFSRSNSSSSHPLFGSSINHNNTIRLTIRHATHERSLTNDWFHGSGEIIEIEMSQTQFAELITQMNMGEGIPCTIKHIDMKRIPDPPYKSKVDIINDEFRARMHNMGVDIEKASATALDLLKSKPTLTKADRELILSSITSLLQGVKSNIPYVSKQFGEQMDKTITEAKGEIEAFIEHKIRSAGLEAIGASKDFPKIQELTDSL